ncbi:DUF2577 domain-containing protein [Sporosarcina sp. resist]|uniref:DUF2577 domain-containing protein n=1 Tax=Sporosarcina sp. resist TaxID=2762563 RepID=UPI00164D3ED4|nr:DUF2577 domain-containing protein [Sporosarcina sp. resist]QNK87742.1 DUF2577 domain-containing protein [Sporosarcina sp. resist]
MLQIIKGAAQEANSASSPVELMEAVVTQAPPELKIMLKSNSKLPISKGIIIVAEHLTRHDRIISIDYEYPKMWEEDSDIGDEAREAESSRNNIGQGPSVPYEKYEMKHAKVTFEDVLKVGDEVLVASLQGGQIFYIMDRVARYE